eukprot:TRINITY_DN4041_c0_g1_i1.p1 TRINITY_DN4041_c0_g1~~TRINITY_DN4041_c0_g1_i1.p1  ORF type:complete len:225 (-),score=53.72 TRINITY_DN4041_c0_g1_i1:26-700(-)
MRGLVVLVVVLAVVVVSCLAEEKGDVMNLFPKANFYASGLGSVKYSGSVDLDASYHLSWVIFSKAGEKFQQIIALTLTVTESAWIGIGFRLPNTTYSGMTKADFLITVFNQTSKTVNVTDRFSTPKEMGYSEPLLDTSIGGEDNIISFSGFQISQPTAVSTVTILRELNTGDKVADHPIIAGEMDVIWAHGNLQAADPNKLAFHGGYHGEQNVNFFTNKLHESK